MLDTGLQKRLWHFFHYFGSIVLQGHHLEMSMARTSIIEAEEILGLEPGNRLVPRNCVVKLHRFL